MGDYAVGGNDGLTLVKGVAALITVSMLPHVPVSAATILIVLLAHVAVAMLGRATGKCQGPIIPLAGQNGVDKPQMGIYMLWAN